MMDNGYIQLHRKLLENPIFRKPELLQLFIYCLLKANHKDNEFIFNKELTKIKRGSFVTGREQMAKDLKQNESTIYKRLKLLEKLEYILLKSNNKFTILTIVKYNTYQSTKEDKEQQSNNKVTTKEQQSNTNNNDNNDNNEKKRTSGFDFSFLDDRFKDIFMRWLQYKKDKRQKYANQDSLESCYNKLIKYSSNDPETAKEIIEDAMAKSYSGFFELKNNNNGKRTRESNSKQQFESVKI